MKKLTILFCLLLFTASASAQSSKEKVINKALGEIAEMFNGKCPIMADSVTRLDSVASLGNITLGYYYTIISTASIENLDKDTFKKIMRKSLTKELKSNDDFVPFNKAGCKLVYTYYNMGGESIAVIKFTPEQYKR